MTIEHNALTADADNHQPFGFAAASGMTVADGAGSSVFAIAVGEETVPNGGGPNTITITAPTVWAKAANHTQGAYIGAGYFTVGSSGSLDNRLTYIGTVDIWVYLTYYGAVAQDNASSQDIYITHAVKGVVDENYQQILTLAQNIEAPFARTAAIKISAGDYLEVFVKCAAGDVTVSSMLIALQGFRLA